jgi:CDP-glycerol glycerophosphotransferase (TagB/SpsB family)
MSASTGWAVRNFFQTGIVEKLKKSYRVVVFAPATIRNHLISSGLGFGITVLSLENEREPFLWMIFRQARKKVYMECRKSSTEALWAKYTKRPFYQKAGSFLAGIFLKFVSGRRLMVALESIDYKINKSHRLEAIFNEHNPKLYFATHASSYFEELLLRTALAKNVPAVYMVLSWDHLSSKIVLNKKYRSIFVWNKMTKSEILSTYPSYKDNQIKIVGVPQYDIYGKKTKISRLEWCQLYGLNPNRPVILFSTMPQVRHNQQHIIIEKLLEEIDKGDKLPNNLQVLIKCHPFDNTDKYDSLLTKYPVSICRSSLRPGLSQASWIPSEKEMEASRDCLFFCDININIFSTVTLEAAYFGKPIIHIAFDPFPIKNRIPCKEYYNFEHFKKIAMAKAARMVYSYEDMFLAINNYLKNPGLDSEKRRDLVKEYFTVEPGLASGNLVKELVDLKNNLLN